MRYGQIFSKRQYDSGTFFVRDLRNWLRFMIIFRKESEKKVVFSRHNVGNTDANCIVDFRVISSSILLLIEYLKDCTDSYSDICYQDPEMWVPPK